MSGRGWGGWVGIAGAVLVSAAASAAGAGLRLAAVGSGPVRELAEMGARTSLEVVLTGDPQLKRVGTREVALVRGRAVAVRAGGQMVDVRVPVLLIASGGAWRSLLPSQRVRVGARLDVPRSGELLAAVALVRGPPLVIGGPSAVQRVAERVRAGLREACRELPAERRGVLPGMVVGDTSQLGEELEEDFRTAGLTHLLVVSGANLAIVAGAVMAFCRLVGLGRRRAPFLAGAALIAFVVVARPEPSVLRAAVMSVIALLAYFLGRERQGVPALSAAVLLLILLDPGLARSYGFALSAAATGGLLVVAPRWRDRLADRLPGPVAEALAAAAAAQLACTPILVVLTGQVGLVAVAANLLAAPAVSPATLLGALAALTAPIAMPPAQILAWSASLAAGWIVTIAHTAADLPYATVPWRSDLLGAALLIAAVAAVIAAVRCRGSLALMVCFSAGVLAVAVMWRAAVPGRGDLLGAVLLVVAVAGGLVAVRYRAWLVLLAAVCSAVVLASAVMRYCARGWPPAGWLYVVCDVGQGDASVLSVGPGQAVVIDAGPDPPRIDGCLDRLGVRAVPLLILTHPHADHIDGVPGVRHGRAVGMVMTSPLTYGKKRRLIPGKALRAPTAGQEWRLGNLTLTDLGPVEASPFLISRSDSTGVNNASLVMVARRPGLSVLLTGDIEAEAQRSLVSRVPRVDVLKVPHHGSSSQHPAFLAAAHAPISIASMGRDNDYGHPAPSTVSLLRRLGTRLYRTDRNGDIAITRTPQGLAVTTRR